MPGITGRAVSSAVDAGFASVLDSVVASSRSAGTAFTGGTLAVAVFLATLFVRTSRAVPTTVDVGFGVVLFGVRTAGFLTAPLVASSVLTVARQAAALTEGAGGAVQATAIDVSFVLVELAITAVEWAPIRPSIGRRVGVAGSLVELRREAGRDQ